MVGYALTGWCHDGCRVCADDDQPDHDSACRQTIHYGCRGGAISRFRGASCCCRDYMAQPSFRCVYHRRYCFLLSGRCHSGHPAFDFAADLQSHGRFGQHRTDHSGCRLHPAGAPRPPYLFCVLPVVLQQVISRCWAKMCAGPVTQAGEYVYDQPHMLGTRRIGPDLTRIGRKYGNDWHAAHHWNPRAVVPDSIMPRFPWLFKDDEGKGAPEYNEDGQALVAYLQRLGTSVSTGASLVLNAPDGGGCTAVELYGKAAGFVASRQTSLSAPLHWLSWH